MTTKNIAQIILAQEDMPPAGGGILGTIVPLAIGIFLLASIWKVFTKAGKPGWACIIPFYNIIVLLEIVGRPLWWIVLVLIPVVNIVAGIILALDLAKSFGKSAGFGIGLALLSFVFYPILGFGSAQYQGPAAAEGTAPAA